MEVLELYSGIGGMHLALTESGVGGKIKASVDINTVANKIYQHNFPDVPLLNKNIQGLTEKMVKKFNVNTILMSPPCQPFTRNGLQGDIKDPRTESFLHILRILPNLDIRNILIENVKGFECSQIRDILVETLKKANYTFQEFLLSPNQIGIPNSRLRYYCLAKKLPENFKFEVGPLMTNLPFTQTTTEDECFPVSDILEENVETENYLIPEDLLRKRLQILDICYLESKRSCCFTKAYKRYLEGCGSVLSPKSQKEAEEIFKTPQTDINYHDMIKSLELRFFTPREVCRLMGFPDSFNFPNDVTNKQKYMVLGNSINVKIVAELIKLF